MKKQKFKPLAKLTESETSDYKKKLSEIQALIKYFKSEMNWEDEDLNKLIDTVVDHLEEAEKELANIFEEYDLEKDK